MSEIGQCLREWVSELVSEWVTGKWSHEWMDTFVSTPGLYITYIKRKRNEKKKNLNFMLILAVFSKKFKYFFYLLYFVLSHPKQLIKFSS